MNSRVIKWQDTYNMIAMDKHHLYNTLIDCSFREGKMNMKWDYKNETQVKEMQKKYARAELKMCFLCYQALKTLVSSWWHWN